MDLDALAAAITPLEAIPKEAPARLSKLYRWSKEVMGRDRMRPQPHAEMTAFLEKSCGDYKFNSGGQKLFMLLVPRACFKTTLGCEDLITLALKENPNLRSMIDCFGHGTSKKRLYGVKWQIENNEKLRDVVGDWKPDFKEDIWSNDQIVISARTKGDKDPSVATGGVDKSMVGSHYDLIVADDLVNDINCRTKDGRDKVYEHITNLLSILEPNGTLVVIGTRWHWDDAYGRILEADKERSRQGLDPEWNSLIRSCYLPDGSLYFPEELTVSFLDDKRRRNASTYAANFLNQPIADEDRTFTDIERHIEPFNFYTVGTKKNGLIRSDELQAPVYVTGAWDPAGVRASKRSNKHGITVVGTDPDNHWWILDAQGIKGTPEYVINHVCDVIARYRISKLSCEDVQSQLLWLHLLTIELKKRSLYCELVEYSTGGVPKAVRIELLQPKWSAGEIHLQPNQIDMRKQFEDYNATFTEDHFDILDSLVQHMDISRPAKGGFEYSRNDDNPIDPEIARFEKQHGRLPGNLKNLMEKPLSRLANRWMARKP
jgi:hypothetical protein